MKIRLFSVLAGVLLVAACSKESFPEQHGEYLANKGWEINESIKVETYVLDIPHEMLSNYEASGITFMNEYLGEEITQHAYELKEKDIDGKRLKAVVFETEAEIIGGYGVLPNWDPGTFNLDDKERLMNEQIIKQ